MNYFGKAWSHNILTHYECTPTPVGHPCMWCEEELVEGDQGFVMPCGSVITMDEETKIFDKMVATFAAVHLDCFLREIVGSVGHQTKQCSCFGGDTEDPEGMTKREAAKASVKIYKERSGL